MKKWNVALTLAGFQAMKKFNVSLWEAVLVSLCTCVHKKFSALMASACCGTPLQTLKGSTFHKCIAEQFLPSEIAEASHIRFPVWERKIAVQIGLTLPLFNSRALETEKSFVVRSRGMREVVWGVKNSLQLFLGSRVFLGNLYSLLCPLFCSKSSFA